MEIIKSIGFRKILNSHVRFTNEYIIEFEDGSVGCGGSPQGETISIYEDRKAPLAPEAIVQWMKNDGCSGRPFTQESFDDYLQNYMAAFGRNDSFALSLAYFNATRQTKSLYELFGQRETPLAPPRLALNILNGGWHAYTNPVLSDFSEFMLVSKSNDLEEVISAHNEIQQSVRDRLVHQKKTLVSGNPVNSFSIPDNREVIEFLLDIVEGLNLSGQFDLMIDASAGDLWADGGYTLSITDGSFRTSDAFCEYWNDLIRQYKIRFLEDPFHEKDFNSWQCLTGSGQACRMIGDNLYSSDDGRIREGAEKKLAHAAIIKPNQAGTVTAVRRAIETAQSHGHIVMTSHRSISTESTFISALTCHYGVPYIKIGPLQSDYSSIVRLNEIIRLTGGNYAGGNDHTYN